MKKLLAFVLCLPLILFGASTPASSTRAVYKSNVPMYKDQLIEDLQVGANRTVSFLVNSTLVEHGIITYNPQAGSSFNFANVTVTNLPGSVGTAGGVLSGTYPNPGFAQDMATQVELDAHATNTSNPHSVTKTQVGLSAVPNVDATNASNISSGTLPALRMPAFSGDASVPAGTTNIVLGASGATAGTYGNGSNTIVATVDAKGRVTSISTTPVTGGSATTNATDLTSGTLAVARMPALTGGDASTPLGSGTITLATVNPTVGVYGNATRVPQITVDGKGRITNVSNIVITAGTGNVTGVFTTDNQITVTSGANGIIQVPVTVDPATGDITLANLTVTNNLTASALVGSLYKNIIIGNSTVTANTTQNVTFASANSNLTITGDNTTKTVTFNVTSSAGSAFANERIFYLTVDSLADSLNYGLGFVSAAFTISEIKAVHTGSGLSSPSVNLKVYKGTDRSSGTAVVTAGSTVTSSTTGTDVTSFDSAGVSANSWLWITTSSKSGTTGNFEVIVKGTYD